MMPMEMVDDSTKPIFPISVASSKRAKQNSQNKNASLPLVLLQNHRRMQNLQQHAPITNVLKFWVPVQEHAVMLVLLVLLQSRVSQDSMKPVLLATILGVLRARIKLIVRPIQPTAAARWHCIHIKKYALP
tara:strand:+ start:319 stop:711 length:393 start_codon:yes stop_codon:yes gene_type:complete